MLSTARTTCLLGRGWEACGWLRRGQQERVSSSPPLQNQSDGVLHCSLAHAAPCRAVAEPCSVGVFLGTAECCWKPFELLPPGTGLPRVKLGLLPLLLKGGRAVKQCVS